MTSTAAYREFLNILNKASAGNVIIESFEQLWEDMQLEFYKESRPPKAEIVSMGRLSRFQRTFVLPASNGIVTFDPDREMLIPPVSWIMGYRNPPCGESVGTSYRIPVEIVSLQEFISAEGDTIDFPAFDRPIGVLVDSNKIQLLPKEISHLHGTFWRKPRRIVVGRDPLTTAPAEEPMEGGAGQVNPEWDDIDCHTILHKCVTLAGAKLQNQMLVQMGMAFSREGQS